METDGGEVIKERETKEEKTMTTTATAENQDRTPEISTRNLHTLNPTNPLRINVIHQAAYPPVASSTLHPQPYPPVASSTLHLQPSPEAASFASTPQQHPYPQPSLTVSTSNTPQQQVSTLNSRAFTNRISLFLFLVHLIAALSLVCFLIFEAVKGLVTKQDDMMMRKEKRVLQYWLPQVECSTLLSILMALAWQKSFRTWPAFMVRFILWTSFVCNLSAGILLLCFQRPTTEALGVLLVAFSIGNGLYACWVNQRIDFTAKLISKSLEPVAKFSDLTRPTYLMLGIGFIWISLWVIAMIGALNFYFPALMVITLSLSLAWTAEVLRNVANLTVSRVIALYYMRGMQSSTGFCFQRALSRNLGSACLGSLFVPGIEFLRIIARALSLLKGEDEFMFSCAHCCLQVMESIFRYGNGWAFVQVAAYGKGFVKASQDTWSLFERQEMEPVVDSDITSSICFLCGVCSGSICIIAIASWTAVVHMSHTATVSMLSFFIGYLLTRIAMALPHACVSCYYVCYAENPDNRLFDKTIPERINFIKSGRDLLVPTPRVPVPRRFRA